jgi:hypothetical protein
MRVGRQPHRVSPLREETLPVELLPHPSTAPGYPMAKLRRARAGAGLAALDGPSAAGHAGRVPARRSQVLRQRDQWPLRIAGSLFGLGCCAVGLFSVFGGGEALPELNRERALGFGIAAIVVGLVALIGSLTGDAHRLWYCMPRRWRAFRADVLDGWDAPKAPAPPGITPADNASADR